MLEGLFGNQNIEKILIFLFVNGKCYGTQLHRALQTPLTPIQKALNRLEAGGLIASYYEGKTRMYEFNPSLQVLPELEQLLKKTYTLLPPQEKKLYYIAKESRPLRAAKTEHLALLLNFWERLKQVKKVAFHAKTRSKNSSGWDGKGKGIVTVTQEEENRLIFSEKGAWNGKPGKEIGFSNMSRWTLDKAGERISLEHLRRGKSDPVFLFHLAPAGALTLSSVDAHQCRADSYLGSLHMDQHSLRLCWRVIGPDKNEELDYYYF
jgi:hypothetical protein